MNLIVRQTSILQGKVNAPSSKSQTIRALLFAMLSHGTSVIKNALQADDTQDAINVCKQLGADMQITDDTLVIKSSGLPLRALADNFYTGNSGITTRFLMPILGLRENSKQPVILDCGAQMRLRPIKPLVTALNGLGLNITYLGRQGMLPVALSGKLRGGKVAITGLTSQYLSALLISLPCAELDSEIIVKDLHERPYVEMTLHWLKQQNIQFIHHQSKTVDKFIINGKQQYKNINAVIGGDFSSASYLIAAGALIPGEVILTGLNMNDPQGDKRFVKILQAMGADLHACTDLLIIRGGKKLQGIKIDANDIPDLLPTLAVIGTYAWGETSIYNVKQARIKETDRIRSMAEGLKKMGAVIEEYEDGLTIRQGKLQGMQVNGYDDHRTVMGLSLAGMLARGSTTITHATAINKTFPTFICKMQSLGANMEVQHASAS